MSTIDIMSTEQSGVTKHVSVVGTYLGVEFECLVDINEWENLSITEYKAQDVEWTTLNRPFKDSSLMEKAESQIKKECEDFLRRTDDSAE